MSLVILFSLKPRLPNFVLQHWRKTKAVRQNLKWKSWTWGCIFLCHSTCDVCLFLAEAIKARHYDSKSFLIILMLYNRETFAMGQASTFWMFISISIVDSQLTQIIASQVVKNNPFEMLHIAILDIKLLKNSSCQDKAHRRIHDLKWTFRYTYVGGG